MPPENSSSVIEKPFDLFNHPKKSRCVIAGQDFPRDSIIEKAPVIIISQRDWQIMEKTVLHNYAFGWGPDQDQAAIALGWGSLFNHSYKPNAFYRKNLKEQFIEFIALNDIFRGEEITVNYSGTPFGKEPMWFNMARS